ncbi:MAG: ATP-binding protein [Acidobacteriota bacterium]
MVQRKAWLSRIGRAWSRRSVVWLSGVRRVGKTYLSRSLPGAEYFDCELPRVRQAMEDPESFLRQFEGRQLVLDEIHRLANPSELLKIAADHLPGTRILAAGSSTLGASSKFRDTLAGRKAEILLTPMTAADLSDFGRTDLPHRLLRGGLPPFFLSERLPERDFQEWMDGYWAKDIQELFRLERRHSFQKFTELLMARSGGIFEATRFGRECEVSRTTISNYLAVLEATFVVHVLRPYASSPTAEIVSAPRVYAFDTGFVCYYRGIHDLRREDLGFLWEHFVLNEIISQEQNRAVHYWRDKRGHEVDFVIAPRGRAPLAIECKWAPSDLDYSGILAFHHRYPGSSLYVVLPEHRGPGLRRVQGAEVRLVNLAGLMAVLPGHQT